MKNAMRMTRALPAAVLVAVLMLFSGQARADDTPTVISTSNAVTQNAPPQNTLPSAAASPLAGVAFDDRPLVLPMQHNFQTAMQTASSELGRTCGPMEAYGWRMSQSEQPRVNQIFNTTVERMRSLGYTVAPQTLKSVSNDITLFTADSAKKHFIFLWSAGDLGLVMTLCESSASTAATAQPTSLTPSVQVFPILTEDVVSSHLENPAKKISGTFTPLGKWAGGYTCAQGYTGGTLDITHVHGQDFDGIFSFYPTVKNKAVPPGSYTVVGQYDLVTKEAVVNPGKWIQRPRNFYNTVMVGTFDPINESLSAVFEGVTGCTSFEAKRAVTPIVTEAVAKKEKARHKAKKKKIVKHKPKQAQGQNLPVVLPLTGDAIPAAPLPTAPAVQGAKTVPMIPAQSPVLPADDVKNAIAPPPVPVPPASAAPAQ